eukprot:14970084-Ditylum_brightwellii.AAC.1
MLLRYVSIYWDLSYKSRPGGTITHFKQETEVLLVNLYESTDDQQWWKVIDKKQWNVTPSLIIIVLPSSKGIRKAGGLHAAQLKKLKAYGYSTREQLIHVCEHGAPIDQWFWEVWAVPTNRTSPTLP